MSLRRFPWKVPRLTDNSYKLFAAEPTPGHDPKKLILPSRSTNDLANIPQRDIFIEGEDKKPKHTEKDAHDHENGHDHSKPEKSDATTSTSHESGSKDAPPQKEVIRGPWRLLRLLPRESRHIIGRMLTIDPRQRAKMTEILNEPWVSDTVICRQDGAGQVIKAEDHTHILVPPASPTK
jgi:serine/threonine protein kinase